jgi:hypothetical protein
MAVGCGLSWMGARWHGPNRGAMLMTFKGWQFKLGFFQPQQ